VTKIKAWDICAADALVRGAGGDFTDLKGQRLSYDATNPLFTGGLIASADRAKQYLYVQHLEAYAYNEQQKKLFGGDDEKKKKKKKEAATTTEPLSLLLCVCCFFD